MNLWGRFLAALEALYTAPHLLRGQGTHHERSFERLLLRHGILPFTAHHPVGYERHPNGPQRWPDFHLRSGPILLPIELKSTSRSVLHMGQTWIQSDALYVASYYRTHPSPHTREASNEPSVFVSWGKDMKTEEEDRRFREFQYDVKHLRGQRAFSTPVEWRSTVQISYRLEEERRRVCFERVREDLTRWARRAR